MSVEHGNARRGPAIGWMMLYHLPDRVTDAEFEVIEPTKEQHGNEASAGDGTADRPTRGNGNGWNWGTDNTAPCFTDAAHADIIRRIWGQ